MTGMYFEFDGIHSKDLNLMIVSFDGAKNGTATAGNHIEFNTIKLPNSDKWMKTSASYSEVLSFSFQVAKTDCADQTEPISERDLAFYIRWLVRKEYKYLRIIQEGYETIYYNARLNVQRYEAAGKTVGLEITVYCDAPYGYSSIKSFHYSTDRLTDSFELYDDSDEIGYLYPDLVEIEVLQDGEVTLKNNIDGRCTCIKDCMAKDMIVFTSGLKASLQRQHIDGSNREYYNAFPIAGLFKDWCFPRICNTFYERQNLFEITNIRNISIAWRAIRKAVC